MTTILDFKLNNWWTIQSTYKITQSISNALFNQRWDYQSFKTIRDIKVTTRA